MSYAELLRTRLCRPLGMTDTGLGTADARPRGASVFGHEVAAYVDDGYAPCGAIRSTAADLTVLVLDPEREEAVFLATDSAAPGEGFERAALTVLDER